MALRYGSMSGNGATRTVSFDCIIFLDEEELLSSVTVTSQDTTILTISNVAITTALVTANDGSIIQIGKGLTWKNTTLRKVEEDVDILVEFTGDGNTKDDATATQPVVISLRS